MDAIGIFELGAKAGRAYVRAIRQAYRDAKAGESDYYASRLGVAEEGGEALEPGDAWVFEAECMARYAPTPTPVDADGFGPCECVCRLCIQGEHCDTASCATSPDDDPFDFPRAAPTVESRMECDGPDATEPLDMLDDRCNCMAFGDPVFDAEYCSVHKVPSSSAGRGVGSPGVSAGAEEPAPPGGWPTPGEFAAVAVREVLAEHIGYGDVDGIYCSCDAMRDLEDMHDYREHVAAEIQRRIDAGVGATPTPKPAEQPTTFPCVVTGASPTGDFKWFSIKVTYPKSKAPEVGGAAGASRPRHDKGGKSHV